jgi:ABC-type nitrate/sulfonate/bicarbonate transport system permease component
MAPFRGLFEPVELDGRSVLDVSVLFAMIVYGIVALALDALIEWLTARIRAMRWHAPPD